MCYKCLYVLGFIIIFVCIICFIPFNELANWITALSTFAMAIIAGLALNTWKKQQKREKLVTLLEALNEYIYDLQYYEHEGTIFSKLARTNKKEDYRNQELIQQQKNIIDTELAEEAGRYSLYIDNWLIQDSTQVEKLYVLKQNLANYKNKIFEYIKLKINFYCEKNKKENILYGTNDGLLEQIYERKTDLEKTRNLLLKQIEELKEINNKLLN